MEHIIDLFYKINVASSIFFIIMVIIFVVVVISWFLKYINEDHLNLILISFDAILLFGWIITIIFIGIKISMINKSFHESSSYCHVRLSGTPSPPSEILIPPLMKKEKNDFIDEDPYMNMEPIYTQPSKRKLDTENENSRNYANINKENIHRNNSIMNIDKGVPIYENMHRNNSAVPMDIDKSVPRYENPHRNNPAVPMDIDEPIYAQPSKRNNNSGGGGGGLETIHENIEDEYSQDAINEWLIQGSYNPPPTNSTFGAGYYYNNDIKV